MPRRRHAYFPILHGAICLAGFLTGCEGKNASTGSGASSTQPANAGTAPARESIESALSAAQQYINTSDLPKAKAILLRLVDRAPSESHAHELLGQVYGFEAAQAGDQDKGDLVQQFSEKAAEEYARAVELAPESAGLTQSAGMMALTAGQTDKALEYFRAAAKIDPSNPQPVLFSAQVLIQRKDFSSAEKMLGELLASDPDEPYALASMAVIALEKGDAEKAIALAGQARENAPDDVNIRIQEARIHRRAGNARHAVELLAALPEEDREKLVVANELARSLTAINEHDKAKSALELALQHLEKPTDAWRVYVRLGEARLAAGNIDDAKFWLSQAAGRRPKAEEVIALQHAIENGQSISAPE